jgi:hypothetical protein
MARWLLKAGGARVLTLLPASERWHYLAQSRLTRSLRVDPDDFALRLRRCRQHIEDYFSNGPSPTPAFTALELGTGWFPFTPIGLFLCGAERVVTVDKQPFLRRVYVEQALDHLIQSGDQGELKSHLPQMNDERLDLIRRARAASAGTTMEGLLGELRIEVMVGDIRQLELRPASIDLICSDGTLQAIPELQLRDILITFKRLARDAAVMTHDVAFKDAFAVFDHSIGPLNYLRFSDRVWRALGEPLNRLRVSDLRRLHDRTGWRIVREEDVELASPEALEDVRLARRFRHYAPADLRVIRTRMISVPDGTDG